MNYYDFAIKDFRSAETLYTYTEEYDVIVTLCQQYLEKALKYLLEENEGIITKSHKLTVICRELNISYFDQYINFFRQVQDYYFDKRYPGVNYIETTKKEADEVFEQTKLIKEYIESNLIKSDDSQLKQCNVFDNLK